MKRNLTCPGPLSRRSFLSVGSLGVGGLGLSDLLRLRAEAATSPVAPKDKDTSIIFVWLPGGPPHMEMYDMKPDAPSDYRGDFRPIGTNVAGIDVCELLPLHAKIADKFSLVRSCNHTAAAVHDTGHQMCQTGRLFAGGVNTPNAGCALQFLKGSRNELPAHVVLPQPMGPTGGGMPHGQDAGFLGKAYDPFVLGADPSKPNFKVPDLLPPQEIGEARIQRRQTLRDIVDGTVRNFEASESAKLMDSNFANAFKLKVADTVAPRSAPYK